MASTPSDANDSSQALVPLKCWQHLTHQWLLSFWATSPPLQEAQAPGSPPARGRLRSVFTGLPATEGLQMLWPVALGLSSQATLSS